MKNTLTKLSDNYLKYFVQKQSISKMLTRNNRYEGITVERYCGDKKYVKMGVMMILTNL